MCNACQAMAVSGFSGENSQNNFGLIVPFIPKSNISGFADTDLEDDLGIDLDDESTPKKTTAEKVKGWTDVFGGAVDIWNKFKSGDTTSSTSSNSGADDSGDDVSTDNSWIYWTIGGVVVLSLGIWAFVKFGNK